MAPEILVLSSAFNSRTIRAVPGSTHINSHHALPDWGSVHFLGKLKFSDFSLTFNVQPVSALSDCCFVLLLRQLGGSFLLGVGVWVLVDPTGFREIIAANPLLFTGVYVILGMGGMLFLLGFLGCCGAIRENKCLLLFVSPNSESIFKVSFS